MKVRSKKEILRTLDANKRLENLPLTREMFQYWGQEFRVYKRAHKTCDTVSGPSSGYVARIGLAIVEFDIASVRGVKATILVRTDRGRANSCEFNG